MAGRDETFFEKRAEGSIFFHVWVPEGPVKAVIALVHGLGDHSGCFRHFVSAFTAAGFAVMAIDLYGNGRSDGERGDVPRYSLFLEEVDLLLEKIRTRFPGIPLFLYGHSMGGNIALNYALRRRPKITGVVASAPWLEMVANPRRQALWAGLLTLISPRHRFDSGLHPEGLSRDPAYGEVYLSDPLVHGFVSARLFWQASRAGQWALRHAGETLLPTLIIHGEADPITSAAASGRYAAGSAGRAVFHGIPGALHTLHNEQNKEEIFQIVRRWAERVLASRNVAAG